MCQGLRCKNIYAFDIDDEKLKIAKEYGAYCCINTGEKGFKDKIWEATGGRGFEQVIETAGVEFTEKLSLEIASNKGRLCLLAHL